MSILGKTDRVIDTVEHMVQMRLKVTGVGLVSGMGAGAEAVYRGMCAGEHGFRPLTRFDASPYAQQNGGQLSEDLENQLRDVYPDDDISIAMMKHSGREALEQSGMAVGGSDERLGLVLATNFGPMETLEWAWRERLDTGSMDEASYASYGEVVEIIGSFFGCGGPRIQLSMSCASGAAAASAARDLILSGRADRVLVLAYDSLTEYCWCGLSNLRTITTDTMRPFDASRSGTLFSEGAAAVVLSREDVSGEALGWLAGSATNNNAFHMTAPRKDAEGSRLVMLEALRQAGLTVDDVEHVCAHATSTKANDETEAGALRNMFGERLPSVSVGAHKSQLGHLLGAAGLAEAVVTLEAMNHGIIPPTLNHREMDPACVPVDCGGACARAREFGVALTNSAGIGGNNGALVLTKGRPESGVVPQGAGVLYVKGLSWVLPSGIGQGGDILQHPEWLEAKVGGCLEGFSAKGYVSSVKGYLDAGGAYQLASLSMIRGEKTCDFDERRGICTSTRYGACASAYVFFEQLAQKGPRFASPMIFPHGYSNAAGNLASIEFGYCGPHMVLFGKQDICEALEFALMRLSDGSADEMLVGAYEAATVQAIPDGRTVLNGAMSLRVSTEPGPDDICVLEAASWRQAADDGMEFGAVCSLGRLLQGLN